jgi:hypothetical protein
MVVGGIIDFVNSGLGNCAVGYCWAPWETPNLGVSWPMTLNPSLRTRLALRMASGDYSWNHIALVIETEQKKYPQLSQYIWTEYDLWDSQYVINCMNTNGCGGRTLGPNEWHNNRDEVQFTYMSLTPDFAAPFVEIELDFWPKLYDLWRKAGYVFDKSDLKVTKIYLVEEVDHPASVWLDYFEVWVDEAAPSSMAVPLVLAVSAGIVAILLLAKRK